MIGLVGYFGYGNYGDEIFLQKWRQIFGLDKTQVLLPEDNLDEITDIVIGGGDLLWNYGVNNNYFNDAWYKENKNIYVYGVGVPLPSEGIDDANVKQLYINFLDKAKYLSVRDIKSKVWVEKVLGIKDVKVVADIAWSFKSSVKFQQNFDRRKVVGLTFRRTPLFSLDDIVRLCLILIEKKFRIELIPLQDGYHTTRELHKIIEDEIMRKTSYPTVNIINENLDIEHKYAKIASCDYYITSAFHGVITALKEKVPVLCLGKSNKFSQLLLGLELGNIICGDLNETIDKFNLMIKNYDFKEKGIKYLESRSISDLRMFKKIVLSEKE